jgi:selenocysteine-specific elongation factor
VYDRFALRESGRSETVAGGVVLDAFPPRRAGATAVDRLTVRERATRDELAELVVSERGAVTVADVRIVAGTDPSGIANARRARDWWVHDRVANVVRDGVTAALQAFHDASANAEGRETAAVRRDIVAALRRAGAPSDAEIADALLARLVDDGEIERAGSLFRLPGRTASIATEEVEGVTRAVANAEPTPPTVAELQQRGFSGDAIDAAVRGGKLVRIAPDLVLTRSMVDRAIEVVREAGAQGSTVSSVRERLGTSRRYAVPLMEHLDRTGATRRSGDLRFARGM